MVLAPSLLGLSLFGCARGPLVCGDLADAPITDPDGLLTEAELSDIEHAVAAFVRWTDGQPACVNEIVFVDRIGDHSWHGRYGRDQRVLVSVDLARDHLDRAVRHELCHAFDTASGYDSWHRRDLFGDTESVSDEDYPHEWEKVAERFADACMYGPRDWPRQVIEGHCGLDLMREEQRYINDVVYPAYPGPEDGGVLGAIALSVEWERLSGLPEDLSSVTVSASGDWLWFGLSYNRDLIAEDTDLLSVHAFRASAADPLRAEPVFVEAYTGARPAVLPGEGEVLQVFTDPMATLGRAVGVQGVSDVFTLPGELDVGRVGGRWDADETWLVARGAGDLQRRLFRWSPRSGEVAGFDAPPAVEDSVGIDRTLRVSPVGDHALGATWESPEATMGAVFSTTDHTWSEPVLLDLDPDLSTTSPMPGGMLADGRALTVVEYDRITEERDGRMKDMIQPLVSEPGGGWRMPEGGCPGAFAHLDGPSIVTMVTWGGEPWLVGRERWGSEAYEAGWYVGRVVVGAGVEDF